MSRYPKRDTAPLGTPMMTAEEVTRHLRISYTKLKNLIKAGEIPAIRVGRELRFRQNDVEEWIRSQYINKAGAA